jgi:hypothetical protein
MLKTLNVIARQSAVSLPTLIIIAVNEYISQAVGTPLHIIAAFRDLGVVRGTYFYDDWYFQCV